jgi:hypothetical protein
MARPCDTCKRKDVAHIDARLCSGVPLAQVGREFKINQPALARHKKHAVTAATSKAARLATMTSDRPMIEQLRELQAVNKELCRSALAKGDLRLGASALREAGRLMDIIREMELQEAFVGRGGVEARESYENHRDKLIRKLLGPRLELPDLSGGI